uniref:Sema domain-containing protein n=1 Tax=Glossina brevipalpis TaxID=37001 RepID=A0A1A9WXA1_9MUSC
MQTLESASNLVEGHYGHSSAKLIYGVFNTPTNSIPGSAVCTFSLQDIADTFEGSFKEQSSINSNWLPVNNAKVPEPRPGSCHNDSRTLPDPTLNFIKTHSLMDENVPAFFGQPILLFPLCFDSSVIFNFRLNKSNKSKFQPVDYIQLECTTTAIQTINTYSSTTQSASSKQLKLRTAFISRIREDIINYGAQ